MRKRSAISNSIQPSVTDFLWQMARNRLSEIKEVSLKPMLIIAQASLSLGEDFQVIINYKWKYFNQCEVLSVFPHCVYQ